MTSLVLYPHIQASATLTEAVTLMAEGAHTNELREFRHALVLGAEGELVGIISLVGVLRGLEPSLLHATPGRDYQGFVAEEATALELFWEQVFAKGLKEASSVQVGEAAHSIQTTVAPGDSLSRALCLTLEEDLPILPVVEGGRVIGVVRLIDIFIEVAALVSAEGAASDPPHQTAEHGT